MMQKWAVIPWEQYNKQEENSETTPSLDIDDILLGIPKQGRRDASAILRHIQSSPDITWNSRGELVLHGSVIANTHIADLLKFSLFQYKTWEPSGVTAFYRALAESNIPTGLIRNLKSRALLETLKTPRPSGIQATQWLTWE